MLKMLKNKSGLSLIETALMIGILSILALTIVQGVIFVFQNIGLNKARSLALGIANQQMEIIRNLPYDEIGTTAGWPAGNIPSSQNIISDKFTFIINVDVQFIDDPFDGNALGTIPSKPIDTEPSDYKRVEVRVCWNIFPCNNPLKITTTIVPNGVESAPGTGSLFVQVFDAGGVGIPQAEITVSNTNLGINISNTTDNDGNLQILSLPPDIDNYHVEVTKANYSRDYTLDPSGPIANPIKPDVNINAGGVTQTSFAIDHTSNLNIKTVDAPCTALPNINFDMNGSKLDGQLPEVLKFSNSFTTDGDGEYSFSNLEWDNYSFTLNETGYDLAGASLFLPLNLLPNTTQNLIVTLAPKTTNSLLVTVQNISGLPLSGAQIHVTSSGYDETKTTGQGSLQQDDWSGGNGQDNFTDTTKYFSDDGNIDITATGILTLKSDTSAWNYNENFSSATDKDTGGTTANWDTVGNSLILADDPGNPGQYISTGQGQSLTLNSFAGKIVSATLLATENLNGQTIDYYLSSDGGLNFEPVNSGLPHTFNIVGNDLRWRAVLNTTNPVITPELLNITINYDEMIYRSNGILTSSSINTGPSSNFNTFKWLPLSQPPGTGADSVKFQIATNNDNTNWNYLGPDGTNTTYYTASDTTINDVHDGDQYLRYRLYLTTASNSDTPLVTQVSVIHSAGCLPPGQNFFSGLISDTHNIDIALTGYNPYSAAIDINGATNHIITLSPN